MRRIVTLLGAAVGNPMALLFLAPSDRDFLIISLALAVALVTVGTVLRARLEARR